MPPPPPPPPPATRTAAVGLAVRAAFRDLRAANLLVVEAEPRRGGDAVDLLVVAFGLGGVDSFGVAARSGEQHPVEVAALPQLVVRAGVEHRALVHDDDAIGERERRAPVRDEDRRARARDLAQRRVDLLFDARVDRRGRVVEEQDLRIGEQRARERDALALTARQREPLLADDGVVPVRAGAG